MPCSSFSADIFFELNLVFTFSVCPLISISFCGLWTLDVGLFSSSTSVKAPSFVENLSIPGLVVFCSVCFSFCFSVSGNWNWNSLPRSRIQFPSAPISQQGGDITFLGVMSIEYGERSGGEYSNGAFGNLYRCLKINKQFFV